MRNQIGRQLLFIILASVVVAQSCASPIAPTTSAPTPTPKPVNPPTQTEKPNYDLYAGFTESKEIHLSYSIRAEKNWESPRIQTRY